MSVAWLRNILIAVFAAAVYVAVPFAVHFLFPLERDGALTLSGILVIFWALLPLALLIKRISDGNVFTAQIIVIILMLAVVLLVLGGDSAHLWN